MILLFFFGRYLHIVSVHLPEHLVILSGNGDIRIFKGYPLKREQILQTDPALPDTRVIKLGDRLRFSGPGADE